MSRLDIFSCIVTFCCNQSHKSKVVTIMNCQFYTHFEISAWHQAWAWGTNFIPMVLQIFALKKVLFLYHHFFYSIDACRNGYLRNIVTTSLFMTLVKSNKSISRNFYSNIFHKNLNFTFRK